MTCKGVLARAREARDAVSEWVEAAFYLLGGHMSGLYHVANLKTLCVITIAAPPAVMAFTTPLECESQCNTIPTHIEPDQCDNNCSQQS